MASGILYVAAVGPFGNGSGSDPGNPVDCSTQVKLDAFWAANLNQGSQTPTTSLTVKLGDTASDTAVNAVRAAAWNAALDAAGSAALDAAWSSARCAAWSAARCAARDAVRCVAWDAEKYEDSIVEKLQKSALEMINACLDLK